MTRLVEGFHPSSVQATIEQLRYWAPSVKDVAHVAEYAANGLWTLAITPHVSTACPVAITLKDDGRFDVEVAGETYLDRRLDALDHIVALLEKVIEGAVVQRRWLSTTTGVPRGIETIVMLDPAVVWREGPEPDGYSERRDRHFLPYRRV